LLSVEETSLRFEENLVAGVQELEAQTNVVLLLVPEADLLNLGRALQFNLLVFQLPVRLQICPLAILENEVEFTMVVGHHHCLQRIRHRDFFTHRAANILLNLNLCSWLRQPQFKLLLLLSFKNRFCLDFQNRCLQKVPHLLQDLLLDRFNLFLLLCNERNLVSDLVHKGLL